MNTTKTTRVKGPVESKRTGLVQAEAAFKLGDADRAAELAQGILKQDPAHLGALETLAKILWRRGSFSQVVAATDKLLALNPYEPGYHALRGAALQAQGRYGEACEAYDRSRELPNCAEALRELQIWQAGLLSDMLQSDPVFKASYRHNAKAACEARGFRFVEQKSEAWHPSQLERSWSYTRPS